MSDEMDPKAFFDTEERKKRGGRPKGSKTRKPETLLSERKLEQLYNRVKPFLSDEQREYVKQVISGEAEVDPMREMELLVRQCSILFSEGSIWWLNEGKVGREIASFADSLRMAIKDLADLRRREEEKAEKDTSDDKESLIEQTRLSQRLRAIGVDFDEDE